MKKKKIVKSKKVDLVKNTNEVANILCELRNISTSENSILYININQDMIIQK